MTIQALESRPNDGADIDVSERIVRLRRRYQEGPAVISVERARLYTRSWLDTEGIGISNAVRVAMAMSHVYENMSIYVDPDDRIAGHWSEQFLGLPLPIERGEYNDVLANELRRRDMLRARVRSGVRAGVYMLRKGATRDALRNHRRLRSSDRNAPLNVGLQTMGERDINRFVIDEADRGELLAELLPAWKGHSLANQLEVRLQDSGLCSNDMADFAVALPGDTSRQVMLLSAATSIATIQGHVILDFDYVLDRGLLAMREEVAEQLAGRQPEEPGADFLRSLLISLDGAITFSERLARRLERSARATTDPIRRGELLEMQSICTRVPLLPARTFAEGVQSIWTLKTLVEVAHPINLHCLGRLDQSLGGLYERDLAEGRITRAAARELIEELLLKAMSQNIRPESNILGNFYQRYLGSTPVTVGGVKRDGTDATNALTSIVVEAAHRSKAVTNINVRIHPGSPDSLLDEVAACLAQGTSSFALLNDEVMVEAMRRRGFTDEDARDYAIMGCVEATCPGKTGAMSASGLQLARLLDLTLRNGDAAILAGTLKDEGLRTGTADSFQTFEELLQAFLQQGRHFIEQIVRGSNLRDDLHAELLPTPMISAFMDGCLSSEKDVTRGGATYDLSGISMINSIANVVDALHVIRTLVFDEERLSLSELLSAVDRDFVGHEDTLAAVRAVPGKWGNGDPATDALAARITGELFAEIYRYRSPKDAPFVSYAISMTTHTIDGRLSIASPDGRRLGTPFAASCNPANVESFGVTGVLRSVAGLPNEDLLGGAVNLKLHPSAIGDSEHTRGKWISLLRTYFRLGGAQLQPTCADAATLRAAQLCPEDHRDLIVKVGGYSTYFVDLGCEIQDEIIARTEHR